MSKPLHIWEGIYRDYAAAERDAAGPGFSGDTWRERSTRAAQECLDALSSKSAIPSFHKQRSTGLPFVAATMVDPRKRLRVLDFGGGLGIGYMTLAEAIPRASLDVDYTILEIPPVCSAGRALHGNSVTYVDALPTTTTYDIVHSASAIQYVADWQALLLGLGSLGASVILLSDVFAGSFSSFVTLQNYYGSRIPHWFMNMDELLTVMAKSGYHLTMKSDVHARRLDIDDVLPMPNFPESHRLDRALHMLFRRHT